MTNLYQKLKLDVTNWRQQSYPSSYPAITTILQHNQNNFLRKAQFEALETYWYLRLVKNTPNIFDLYQDYFPGKNLFEAFGLKHLIENLPEDLITPEFAQGILKKIETDDTFVKQNKLEALRETLTLSYPSYILALAMGAGCKVPNLLIN